MSILKKITILFLLSFTLMSIIGYWIDKINNERITSLIKDKYIIVIDDILKNFENKSKVNSILFANNLKRNENIDISTFEVLYTQNYLFGNVKIVKKPFDDEFIIEIKYLDEQYHLETPDIQNIKDKNMLNFLIGLDIFLLFFTFVFIIKILSPLKNISDKISSFSNGDLSTRIDINTNDEIGKLSKTFNSMADNLEQLIKTREELLRDIGHELRTPITKGIFAIEKIEDIDQKELLKKIFKDLEVLTNELIELEKLNSNKLDKTTFECETLIIEALSKLYLDDESKIDLIIENNFKIQGDIYYLTIVLKNLIDNALKYSKELPIKVVASKHKIAVYNKADKLSNDLEYYLKPFTQESSSRTGFGLGLSIVKKVMAKHDFTLDYRYENSYNVFEIRFIKES